MLETKLCEMVFGSHLYGLNTVNSDKDYKGVFLPNIEDLYLCKAPKTYSFDTKKNSEVKNTVDDVDKEFYSLQYFIDLACEGQSVALDMLHANPKDMIHTTRLWEILVYNRQKFYTKNLTALVGYAKHQAAKYGIKGSRLHDAKIALGILKEYPKERIRDIWDKLPETENLIKVVVGGEKKSYEVCGKNMTLTATCQNYFEMLENFIQKYGERAKMAELSQGVDWKAITHAFRAAYQVKHIFVEGDFSYPLPETDFLMKCKLGELHYGREAGPMLDSLLDEVFKLREDSILPAKVDRAFFNTLISNQYRK